MESSSGNINWETKVQNSVHSMLPLMKEKEIVCVSVCTDPLFHNG